MLPTINGKSFLECSEDDFKEIINDSVFRENEFIDYKEFFSIDNHPKGPERDKAIAEFRSDICSFANANGGFLIIGIHEDNGVPSNICGIEIKDDNPDRFELRLKNYLQAIQPRVPSCQFHFIMLENGKTLVIIFIKHDAFAPYIHLENGKDYRVYKRMGNSKTVIAYADLKKMFVKSVALEKEIRDYRLERIEVFQKYGKKTYLTSPPFFLFHIIPETFLDTTYNQNYYVIEKKKRANFIELFYKVGDVVGFMPTVDGLNFPPRTTDVQCNLCNNGIVEVYQPLCTFLKKDSENRDRLDYWGILSTIDEVFPQYMRKMNPFLSANFVYLCCSIVDCENIYTDCREGSLVHGKIDREIVLCPPVMIENSDDDSSIELAKKRLKLDVSLSVGIKNSQLLNDLINDLYP